VKVVRRSEKNISLLREEKYMIHDTVCIILIIIIYIIYYIF